MANLAQTFFDEKRVLQRKKEGRSMNYEGESALSSAVINYQ